jgi:hypothetical protein
MQIALNKTSHLDGLGGSIADFNFKYGTGK